MPCVDVFPPDFQRLVFLSLIQVFCNAGIATKGPYLLGDVGFFVFR
jgi:hypothetical protein